MTHKDFQTLAVRTESIVGSIESTEIDLQVFEDALSAAVHIIDVLDVYKKSLFYGGELDKEKILTKLAVAQGDIEDALAGIIESRRMRDDMQVGVSLSIDPRVFHAILGTITEHGEIADALLTGMNREDGIDLVNMCEELGDSDWYKALFYEATGIGWGDVQAMIIKKLELRYKDKIFTKEEAESRDLVAERQLLHDAINEAIAEYTA
jgi:hypothetical protein